MSFDNLIPPTFDDSELRTPPHSIDAEQSVLGGLLINPNKYPSVEELITEADFYRSSHRLIFRAITKIIDAGSEPDAITVIDALMSADEIEQVGGPAYVIDLARNTSSTGNLGAYAKLIKNKSIERALLSASVELGGIVYDPDLTTEDKILQAQALVLGMESCDGEDVAQVNSAIKATVDTIDQRFNGGGGMVGLSTGYVEIDARTNGLRAGNLIILAARPAMGKTSLAMNIVEHVVVRERKPVLVFSMEMSREELMERMIASLGSIPFSLIQTGKLRDDHWSKLSLAVRSLKDSSLYVDDRAGLSINQMMSAARRMHQKTGGLGLVVVDYLQLAEAKAQSREQEISKISRGLKKIAKELSIPVLALSQLNRDCEKRQNKRPTLSDLRDSGSIEQDADAVMFLYRDEVYNENSQLRGVAEIGWAKIRNGVTGKDHLRTRLDICRFENMDGMVVPEIQEQRGNVVNGRFDY